MTQLDGFITLAGKTFEEVHERLRAKLPDDAYKQHPTKTFLTDINPAYLYEALNDVFGPCGIGWGIDYGTDPDAAQIFSEERQSRRDDGSTRAYRMWVANVKRAEFWYVYTMDGNLPASRATIPTTGASENEDYSYALRGALTSALSGACKWLEWQFHIYSGEKSESAPQGTHTGMQKPPADKPELFVMPFGKNKGKTLAEIKIEDFGYLTWLAEQCNKEDIRELAKQVIKGQPQAKASAQPEPSSNGDHWIKNDVNRRSFYGNLSNMKVTSEEAHAVLVGEGHHLEEYGGTMGDALMLLRTWAIEQGRITR